VERADLVLTMTSEHRGAVLQLAPSALRRTFTLAEAMSLAGMPGPLDTGDGGTTAERLADLVPRLAAARGRLRRPHPGFPDVVDPVGRSFALHRQAAAAIEQALAVLVPKLRAAAAR
jgi:protein-tyrosine phosphatase